MDMCPLVLPYQGLKEPILFSARKNPDFQFPRALYQVDHFIHLARHASSDVRRRGLLKI